MLKFFLGYFTFFYCAINLAMENQQAHLQNLPIELQRSIIIKLAFSWDCKDICLLKKDLANLSLINNHFYFQITQDSFVKDIINAIATRKYGNFNYWSNDYADIILSFYYASIGNSKCLKELNLILNNQEKFADFLFETLNGEYEPYCASNACCTKKILYSLIIINNQMHNIINLWNNLKNLLASLELKNFKINNTNFIDPENLEKKTDELTILTWVIKRHQELPMNKIYQNILHKLIKNNYLNIDQIANFIKFQSWLNLQDAQPKDIFLNESDITNIMTII